MKPGIVRRMRDRLALRPGATRRERKVIQEIAGEFTTEELMEFLEGDLYPVAADPKFKAQLREDLWAMVNERQAAKAPRSEPGSEEG